MRFRHVGRSDMSLAFEATSFLPNFSRNSRWTNSTVLVLFAFAKFPPEFTDEKFSHQSRKSSAFFLCYLPLSESKKILSERRTLSHTPLRTVAWHLKVSPDLMKFTARTRPMLIYFVSSSASLRIMIEANFSNFSCLLNSIAVAEPVLGHVPVICRFYLHSSRNPIQFYSCNRIYKHHSTRRKSYTRHEPKLISANASLQNPRS